MKCKTFLSDFFCISLTFFFAFLSHFFCISFTFFHISFAFLLHLHFRNILKRPHLKCKRNVSKQCFFNILKTLHARRVAKCFLTDFIARPKAEAIALPFTMKTCIAIRLKCKEYTIHYKFTNIEI